MLLNNDRQMLISLLIFLLISNAVTLRQDKSILFSRVVIQNLIFASVIAFNSLYLKPLGNGIGIYGGLFNVSTLSQTFNIFIFIISSVILILTAFYPRKIYTLNYSSFYNLLFSKFLYNKNIISNKIGEQFKIIEYALIIVFILCGAVFLMSTGDLISIFLSIELQSYGLYILCTLYRNSESSTASGLTYFLLGGLSSCFILLGSALLYANTGTTNLDNIYLISNMIDYDSNTFANIYIYKANLLNTALIVMSVGFLFKVSAAPFHFWSPDVYDGIPTVVTTYVAIIAKISIFIFLLELFFYIEEYTWKQIFVISSLLSLIIGSVLGLTQSRIKRLFAYSTISHVGFILLALSVDSSESIQSYIFYILQYTIANLNGFVILLTMGYSFYLYTYLNKEDKERKEDLIDKNNSPVQLISQVKGYFSINPFIAMSFAITLFSFVGIPPIAGFFAKQMILSAALDKGYVFMSLVAIVTSVIGAAYYLNVIKQVFFFQNNYKINPSITDKNLTGYIANTGLSLNSEKSKKELITLKPENITINSGLSSSISIITLLLMLFIYIPEEWFNIVSILTLILFKA